MKRIIFFIAITLIAIAANAVEVEYSRIIYNLDETSRTCYVSHSNSGTTEECTLLPSVRVNGIEYTLTGIGSGAFRNAPMKKISIPKTVTSIGYEAFCGCKNLTILELPASLTTLGEDAFKECNKLREIYYNSDDPVALTAHNIFPEGVYGQAVLYMTPKGTAKVRQVYPWFKFTYVKITPGEGFFSYKHEGQWLNYNILDYKTKVCQLREGQNDGSGGLYSYNWGLSGDVIIPAIARNREDEEFKVIDVPKGAFAHCKDMTSVTIPSTVTSIGDLAFMGCTGLTSIHYLPDTLFCSGNANVFSNETYEKATLYLTREGVEIVSIFNVDPWKNFKKIEIDPSLRVPEFTYTYKGHTLNYTILDEDAKTCQPSAGYKGIYEAVPGNNSVTGDLIIPEIAKNGDMEYTVIDIPDFAFYGCEGLKSVAIPNSVISIGLGAFYGCDDLKSVAIPNSVTSIDHGAFFGCSDLNSVTIPKSVTSIGEYAFSQCGNLTSVYYCADEPIEGNANIFSDETYRNASLYMSEAGLAVGRTIDPWKNFTNAEIYEQSGVKAIVADFDETAPYAVYNLSGIKVGDSINSLVPGIYIVRQGSKVIKIAMK